MRLTIVTFGSEGDTRPLAALCRGLMDRGHELLLFADESTLGRPRQLGIPTQALSGELKSTMPSGGPEREVRLPDLIKSASGIKALIAAQSADWLRSVASHARDADAILFSSLAVGIGMVLSEELKKPAMGLFFQPLTPTREFSSSMLPPLKLPGWANRATFAISLRQMWSTCGKPAQIARRAVFGTQPAHPSLLDYPVLYGFSRELVPEPADWPHTHRVCGHWSRAEPDWQPPCDLADFLDA